MVAKSLSFLRRRIWAEAPFAYGYDALAPALTRNALN